MKSVELAKATTGGLALALAFMVASGGSDRAVAQTFAPERFATVQVPGIVGGSIALLSDETTACVITSREAEIHCVNRTGDVIGVFGRKGRGPGEFQLISHLVGGPDNALGVVDDRLERFSVFEPSGILATDVALPDGGWTFGTVRRFDTHLAGIWQSFDVLRRGQASTALLPLIEVDIASGEVAHQEIPPVEAEVECGTIIYGVPTPQGGWVYVACEGHLVFVGEDGTTTVLRAPTYTGELPDDRDVAERGAGGTVAREDLEEYRNTSEHYHLLLAQHKFDEQGRFWIATQRDRDEYSYLDVYVPGDAAFLGSVRVDDRIIGFDLLGSTLVVVVERQVSPENPDGIAERAVDWYDLSGMK